MMRNFLALIAAIGFILATSASANGMEIPETGMNISVDYATEDIIIEGQNGLPLKATAGMGINDEYPRACVMWFYDKGEEIRHDMRQIASEMIDKEVAGALDFYFSNSKTNHTCEIAFVGNNIEYRINRYSMKGNLTWVVLTFPGEWTVNDHQFVPSANKVVVRKLHF